MVSLLPLSKMNFNRSTWPTCNRMFQNFPRTWVLFIFLKEKGSLLDPRTTVNQPLGTDIRRFANNENYTRE